MTRRSLLGLWGWGSGLLTVAAMRVITWNVARRSSRLAEQAAALASREPDVVALQEVTDATLPLWRAVLERIGLPHVRASLDSADPCRAPASRRRTGVLLAIERRRFADPSATLPVPWVETAVAALVDAAHRSSRDPLPPRPQRGQRLGEGAHAPGCSRRARSSRRRRPAWCAATSTPRAASSRAARWSPSRETRAGDCGPSAGPSGTRPSLASFPGCETSATRTRIARLHGYAIARAELDVAAHRRAWRRLAPRSPVQLGRVAAQRPVSTTTPGATRA